ncbi:MAG: hypothetical protein ACQERP_03495 [Pseudomonadota bacterium]
MKGAYLSLFVALIAGCSSLSPYGSKSPVDQALKSCGLGYSTEAGALVEGAYKLAERQADASFKAAFQDSLSTQIMTFANNAREADSENYAKVIDLVKSTQQCVIETVDAYRPKTRADLLSDCSADLQNKVAGNGESWPKIKRTFPVTDHEKFSDENLVMRAFVDTGGSSSYHILVGCRVEGNAYQGLEVID